MQQSSSHMRLNSWKAIARYLDRSERTVRRWELEEALPVHRQMHRAQGNIYAFTDELDQWQAQRSISAQQRQSPELSPTKRDLRGAVVMPFDFVGEDQNKAFLALGYTDELISALSELDGMRVISRTSSMALAQRSLSTREIAAFLNVDFLIEGSVKERGSWLRVSVRLIDCENDQQIWKNSYECAHEDIFSSQETLARETGIALKGEMTAEGAGGMSARASMKLDHWQAMIRARSEALRWTPAAIANAITLLEQVVDQDGNSPQVLAALGRYHLFMREIGADLSDAPLALAGQCLDRLHQTAPDSSSTHQLAAWLSYQGGDIRAAIGHARRSLKLNDSDVDTMMLASYCYLLVGLDDLAAPLIRRLLYVDPMTPLNHSVYACQALFAGRFGEAVEGYRYALELDPSNQLYHLFYAAALALAGQYEDVINVVSQVSDPNNPSPTQRLLQAYENVARGEPLSAEPEIDAAIAASTVDMFPRILAQAYGLAGQSEEALAWLDIAAAKGFCNYPFLSKHDRSFRTLRDMPSGRALLRKIEAQWQAVRTEFVGP